MTSDKIEVVIDLREGGDWSLDLLFAGLVKNLGPARVLDVPYRHKHREWNGIETDWGIERRTLGYTPDNISIPKATVTELTLLASEGRIGRIWLDERMESFNYYRFLRLDQFDIPVVVVAGHDRFWNHSPQFVADLYKGKLQAMLLDNWYPEYSSLPFRTANIRWSCNFDHYWTPPADAPKKDIDICFVGYNSHPDRARFIDHVEKRWGHLNNHIYLERRPDTFEKFVPKKDLFDIMQRSKICLNLRGAADRGKTLRAYEIAHVGSFMLSQDIDDRGMKNDFIDDFHCRYFASEEELDGQIEFALNAAPHVREWIAHNGHERARELSVENRWKAVLEWLDDPFEPGHEDNWRILL